MIGSDADGFQLSISILDDRNAFETPRSSREVVKREVHLAIFLHLLTSNRALKVQAQHNTDFLTPWTLYLHMHERK